MKIILISFLFLSSSIALAAERLDFQLFPLNSEIRYERSAEQILEPRKPSTLAAGLRYGKFSGLFEVSSFSEESGNSALRVERTLQSYLIWTRMHFLSQQRTSFDFSLYAGIAAGFYQEAITTTLNGSASKDLGAQNMAGGLSFGADSAYRLFKSFAVATALEGRLLFGQDFDPNPQISAVWRLGIQF